MPEFRITFLGKVWSLLLLEIIKWDLLTTSDKLKEEFLILLMGQVAANSLICL